MTKTQLITACAAAFARGQNDGEDRAEVEVSPHPDYLMIRLLHGNVELGSLGHLEREVWDGVLAEAQAAGV